MNICFSVISHLHPTLASLLSPGLLNLWGWMPLETQLPDDFFEGEVPSQVGPHGFARQRRSHWLSLCPRPNRHNNSNKPQAGQYKCMTRVQARNGRNQFTAVPSNPSRDSVNDGKRYYCLLCMLSYVVCTSQSMR